MIDLIVKLLERMERYAQQTEKSRTSRDRRCSKRQIR